MTSVTVVDDQPIVRQGMRMFLEGEAGWQVVAETEQGIAAIALAERLQPDVAVVDLLLTDLNGMEVTRRPLQVSTQDARRGGVDVR